VKAGSKHSRRTRASISAAMVTTGRSIKQPVKPPDQIKHGTFWSYGHHGCRCVPCRAANTVYCREYRARKLTCADGRRGEMSGHGAR
jgi:hypothetical protein